MYNFHYNLAVDWEGIYKLVNKMICGNLEQENDF